MVREQRIGRRDDTMSEVEDAERVAEIAKRIRREVGKVIVGQDDAIECLLVALLTDRHCLMVGVPGLAKTLHRLDDGAGSAAPQVLSASSSPPDLMPSDVTGSDDHPG